MRISQSIGPLFHALEKTGLEKFPSDEYLIRKLEELTKIARLPKPNFLSYKMTLYNKRGEIIMQRENIKKGWSAYA